MVCHFPLLTVGRSGWGLRLLSLGAEMGKGPVTPPGVGGSTYFFISMSLQGKGTHLWASDWTSLWPVGTG